MLVLELTTSLGYKTPKTTTFATHSLGTIFGCTASAGALLKLSHQQCNIYCHIQYNKHQVLHVGIEIQII